MPRVRWTPAAETDLEDIAFYVGIENARPQTAARLIDRIVAKCEQYASHPVMGTARPDLGEEIRLFSHSRYVIIYRADDAGLEVLRVVDGARDYPSSFS